MDDELRSTEPDTGLNVASVSFAPIVVVRPYFIFNSTNAEQWGKHVCAGPLDRWEQEKEKKTFAAFF